MAFNIKKIKKEYERLGRVQSLLIPNQMGISFSTNSSAKNEVLVFFENECSFSCILEKIESGYMGSEQIFKKGRDIKYVGNGLVIFHYESPLSSSGDVWHTYELYAEETFKKTIF